MYLENTQPFTLSPYYACAKSNAKSNTYVLREFLQVTYVEQGVKSIVHHFYEEFLFRIFGGALQQGRAWLLP